MKYELLKNNFIEYKGRKLYRIRALKSFSDIKCGDIGGYVENEKIYHKMEIVGYIIMQKFMMMVGFLIMP